MDVSFYRSSKGRLLFSLRGRIARTDFWVGMTVIAVMVALAMLLGGHRVRGGSLGEFFAVVTAIAVLSPFCVVAVIVKRLHDLDRSGWHALILFVPLLLAAVALIVYGGLQDGRIIVEAQRYFTGVFYLTSGGALALLMYVVAKLGLTRGKPGPNRFGPEPT
jgi:uncharacterized membrane protein YhaH (DUF805 family)